MNQKERMLAGELYNPYQVDDHTWERSRKALELFNSLPFTKHKEGMQALREIFGYLPEDAIIVPPFYCDKGAQIYIGNHFYANTGLTILDEAKVTIGDNVFLGPGVHIYTAGHPIDAFVRNLELEYAKAVTIRSDVWIGGNVVINPGVTIGSNVVIGSGSVVTKNIPDGVIAAGNPCRVIREITDEDNKYWNDKLQEYQRDVDD
ncbi:MAG: sugar O-acetyltransferase [Clostridiales bacterium]|nr:sugar O-acetyltransferase [Clostridiales bacterium]